MPIDNALFWQVLQDRKSVRRYKDQPVPEAMVQRLLEAAKLAPVAGGNRNVLCQTFSDREQIQQLAAGVKKICTEAMEKIPDESLKRETLAYSSSFSWFGKAPLLLAVSCRKMPSYMTILIKKGAEDLFGSKASAAMAAQNIMLAATALGLGSCCLTGPLLAKDWLQKELGCPGQNDLVALITVGYPARGMKDSGEPPVE